mmetsp:Transcript_32446/g.82415  ORF Transcript_32446/g.82415 Transcript_32446/m.82415 type:complete len:307 (-) Transcript_32446:412-1332(-)
MRDGGWRAHRAVVVVATQPLPQGAAPAAVLQDAHARGEHPAGAAVGQAQQVAARRAVTAHHAVRAKPAGRGRARRARHNARGCAHARVVHVERVAGAGRGHGAVRRAAREGGARHEHRHLLRHHLRDDVRLLAAQALHLLARHPQLPVHLAVPHHRALQRHHALAQVLQVALRDALRRHQAPHLALDRRHLARVGARVHLQRLQAQLVLLLPLVQDLQALTDGVHLVHHSLQALQGLHALRQLVQLRLDARHVPAAHASRLHAPLDFRHALAHLGRLRARQRLRAPLHALALQLERLRRRAQPVTV